MSYPKNINKLYMNFTKNKSKRRDDYRVKVVNFIIILAVNYKVIN